MRFLADERCDFAIVRALRSLGYDVAAVSEFEQRSVDQKLMEAAFREDRILLTEGKDFGWLAFAAHMDQPGCRVDPVPGGCPANTAIGRDAPRCRVRSAVERSFRCLDPRLSSNLQNPAS